MRPQTRSAVSLDFALVGHNIRFNRMALNKTQAQLADLAGVSRSTVRRIESGSPVHVRNLEKLISQIKDIKNDLADIKRTMH